MKSTLWVVPAGVLGIGALVYGAGVALAHPSGHTGIAVGVAVGCIFQMLLLLTARVAFPGNQLAGYAVGLMGRLLLVGAAAMILVPATGLPAAPTLLSLVSVLFATTLLEPVALAAGTRNKS